MTDTRDPSQEQLVEPRDLAPSTRNRELSPEELAESSALVRVYCRISLPNKRISRSLHLVNLASPVDSGE
ncbi:MAG: hypothetical protein QOC62_1264 [Mycobacterium sp.]|nr:hypothetical protein [Mycobacterium sp.]